MIIKQCFLPLFALLCLPSAVSAAEARRPNFILFLIDDQDFESVSAYGG